MPLWLLGLAAVLLGPAPGCGLPARPERVAPGPRPTTARFVAAAPAGPSELRLRPRLPVARDSPQGGAAAEWDDRHEAGRAEAGSLALQWTALLPLLGLCLGGVRWAAKRLGTSPHGADLLVVHMAAVSGQPPPPAAPSWPLPPAPIEEDAEAALPADSSDAGPPRPRPKLLVFDLDETVWTPQLYKVRISTFGLPLHLREPFWPRAERDIMLLPGAQRILSRLAGYLNPGRPLQGTRVAFVADSNETAWGLDLLDSFWVGFNKDVTTLRQMSGDDALIRVFRGPRERHIRALQLATGIAPEDMLYFDDLMEEPKGTCDTVARMGVLTMHVPTGLTESAWNLALHVFAERRAAGDPMGVVLSETLGVRVPPLVPPPAVPKPTPKPKPKAKRFLRPPRLPSSSPWPSIPCLLLGQPYPALVLNGVKTLVTQNTPVLKDLEGRWCAILVDKEPSGDDVTWREIMDRAGVDPLEQERLAALPHALMRGDVGGFIKLGATARVEELIRDHPAGPVAGWQAVEQAALARRWDMGVFATQVVDTRWMHHRVPLEPRVDVPLWQVPIHSLGLRAGVVAMLQAAATAEVDGRAGPPPAPASPPAAPQPATPLPGEGRPAA